MPRIISSATARCSITSEIDQRSGAALKFHCASDSPLVASMTPFFVDSKYAKARSLSACKTSCAFTATAVHTVNKIATPPTRGFLIRMFCLLLFVLELSARHNDPDLVRRLSLGGTTSHQLLVG